ncbi:LytTR family DNA-binding domain-containing protein [Ekhidna sp.]|uniref:LytR/AlgR family response regulator transcription factor n=1 Tax=Ekhidna sp. TaxID=2608089 RepID=UPI00329969C8
MFTKREFVFWTIVWVILTLLFSSSIESFMVSFYFVTILMPVVIATSIFFNRFLLPRFLLMNRKMKFTIYFAYMLIVSIYLELLVMVVAFVILADYQIENLGKIAGDIYLLTVVLYLVVLVEGLILSIQKLREKANEVDEFKIKLEKEHQKMLSIRSNRKQVVLPLNAILYVESLGDYVQIHSLSESHTTKEKISSLNDRLPDSFIRIHRSFVVNKDRVSSFNKEEVSIGDLSIPIGRKYKKFAEELLNQNVIA